MKNSFIKYLVIAGIPIVIFFEIFFTWVMEPGESLLFGSAIGLFVGGFVSLVLGTFYSTSAQEVLADIQRQANARREQAKGQPKKKIPVLLFLSYAIVLAGAGVTRYTGHLLPSFPVTIALSMGAMLLIAFYSKEYRQGFGESNFVRFIHVMTFVIPFCVTFFVFLFALHGFDFENMKSLSF